MNTEGITFPIDVSNKRWIQNENELTIGSKYTVFKEWSRCPYNPTERIFHMFVAKLSRIRYGSTLAEDSEIPIYNFEDFEFYYGNNSAYSHIQAVVPITASFVSYSPNVTGMQLYPCYFFSDYLKPLPTKIARAIELYSYNKTKDEIGKKTGLPNDILNFIIPEYISFSRNKDNT